MNLVSHKATLIRHSALLAIALFFNNSYANGILLPLSNWIASRNNLSVEDTAYLGMRCGVAYSINQNALEQFSLGSNTDALKEKIKVYFWISAQYSSILAKKFNAKEKDQFMKKQTSFANELYDQYYDALKKNQPIPYSLSNELLATDIGVCNSTNEKIFDAYGLMKTKLGATAKSTL